MSFVCYVALLLYMADEENAASETEARLAGLFQGWLDNTANILKR